MGLIREYTRRDGSTTYHAEVRLRGFPPQRASFRTKTQAKQWVQKVESDIRDGRHINVVEAKKHTVKDLVERFISQWLPQYPDRLKKQSALLAWWQGRLGHLSLNDLKPAAIAEARDALLSEQSCRGGLRNPSTVNRYLAAFSKALMIAVKEWGWLDDSPMRKVSKPKEGKARDRFLSYEEKDRLLSACKDSSNPHLYAVVSLALLSGMRFTEIVTLTWRDIDLDNKVITLHKTKNGEKRYVSITSTIENLLISLPDRAGLLFKPHRPNNRKGVISVRKAFEKALATAQIEGVRFHDLRHTSASYMAMNGATQGELMAILGHKTPQMTKRYAHYSQGHLRAVLEKTNSILNQKDR
jgi:integrase